LSTAELHPIVGPVASEDLVRVPGTDWLIASGLNVGQPARFFLVAASSKVACPLEVDWAAPPADGDPTWDCLDPPDPGRLSTDGLAIRDDLGGRHVLYAANHGDRLAIEAFEVDARCSPPRVRWQGCALMPPDLIPNAVRPVEDSGLLVVGPYDSRDERAWDRMARGENTGYIVEWRPGHGTRRLPNSAMSGGNGLEVSVDGDVVFASAWSARILVVLSRRDGARRDIALDFMPDNIHRLWDGTLLVAGQRTTVAAIRSCTGPQCPQPWAVVRVDPRSGNILPIVEQNGTRAINYACGALAVGDALFITARGEHSLVYQLLPQTGQLSGTGTTLRPSRHKAPK
jgi:hypothetical protein